jgi:hypothetical protein
MAIKSPTKRRSSPKVSISLAAVCIAIIVGIFFYFDNSSNAPTIDILLANESIDNLNSELDQLLQDPAIVNRTRNHITTAKSNLEKVKIKFSLNEAGHAVNELSKIANRLEKVNRLGLDTTHVLTILLNLARSEAQKSRNETADIAGANERVDKELSDMAKFYAEADRLAALGQVGSAVKLISKGLRRAVHAYERLEGN